MVDTSLNRSYTAREGAPMEFTLIPDGTYRAKVKEVTPWTPKKQNIKVIQRDEEGKALIDEKGDKVTELVNDCEFYNCTVKMEIVEQGDYKGRIIFHNLSTHPNMPFNIPAFLYGIGMKELMASEIQSKTINKECLIEVYTDSYTKDVEDKETGMVEKVKKEINRINYFKQLPDLQQPSDEMDDLGI